MTGKELFEFMSQVNRDQAAALLAEEDATAKFQDDLDDRRAQFIEEQRYWQERSEADWGRM